MLLTLFILLFLLSIKLNSMKKKHIWMVTTSPAGGQSKWVLVPSNSLKSAGHKVYSESIQSSEAVKLQKEQTAPYNNAK